MNKWQDSLSDRPILCWVWDMENLENASMIWETYESQFGTQYRDTNGVSYKFATPVKPEECYNE